jgi:ABC-type glutathione transport system ATPase component
MRCVTHIVRQVLQAPFELSGAVLHISTRLPGFTKLVDRPKSKTLGTCVLLDEATSALDSHSEMLVRDALAKITTDVTTIVIAHRLSTVMNADRICYLENGQIVEQGTIEELTSTGGKFKELHDIQFNNKSAVSL